MMLSLLAVLAELLACLGLGAALLRALKLFEAVPEPERPSWAFAAGFGLLSCIVFPLALAGLIAPPILWGVLLACALGVLAFPKPGWRLPLPEGGYLTWLLLALLVLCLGLYLAGALAPPADGDSMAYHFARIKQVASQGKLTFLPLAIEGAAPMMAHMTYLPAYVLGGEQALTSWTTLSGLLAGLFVYTAALRWVTPRHALILALLLITTPAAIFGTSSGQVEIRNAHFVLLSALAMMEARRANSWRWHLLAGLGSGFFAGSKVFGLIWVGAGGLVSILRRQGWFKAGLVFGLFALLAACPWYIWNYAVTGDPLFPMLQRVLHIPDGPWWTRAHLDELNEALKAVEQPAPPTLGWYLAYPFLATLHGLKMWESSRTGLGLFCLMALPFALAGAWRRSGQPGRSPLWTAAGLVFVFYTVWFFFGTAQRVRHLLPLYPLLLLLVGVAAFRLQEGGKAAAALLAGTLAVLAIQTGGLGLFSLPALKYLATGETREAYLSRAIPFYDIVPWINSRLTDQDRILVGERQLLYQLEVPYFFGDFTHQAEIDLRYDAPDNVEKRWAELRRLGITHVLLTPALDDPEANSSLHRILRALAPLGCSRRRHGQDGHVFASRTLSSYVAWTQRLEIYALTPTSCQLERGLQNPANTVTNTVILNKESPQ